MLKLLLLSAALLSGSAHEHPANGKKPSVPAKRPASFRLPSLHTGRCSGGANCRACSNCNYCGHCAGGGGTCSVCADYSAPVARPARTVRSYGGSRSTSGRSLTSTRTAPAMVEGRAYYVAVSTLNLRAEPSADAEVVQELTRGELVVVKELVNAQWVRVSVEGSKGEEEGYVFRAYLVASLN